VNKRARHQPLVAHHHHHHQIAGGTCCSGTLNGRRTTELCAITHVGKQQYQLQSNKRVALLRGSAVIPTLQALPLQAPAAALQGFKTAG
jgi:hypothetical protein